MQAEKPDLTVLGLMLANLSVVDTSDNKIVIGFDDPEAARIAYYHNISGAGKSRVLRKFLGLQEKQWEDKTLANILAEGIIFDIGKI